MGKNKRSRRDLGKEGWETCPTLWGEEVRIRGKRRRRRREERERREDGQLGKFGGG